MTKFISGADIVIRYGLQPFQVVHFCKKGLQPYELTTGRCLRDPSLPPLPHQKGGATPNRQFYLNYPFDNS